MIEIDPGKYSAKDFPIFVKVKSDGRGSVEVRWGVRIMIKQGKDKLSCFIPGLNIYFSASDQSMVDKKAWILSKSFFDFYLLGNKEGVIETLSRQLTKKGFTLDNYSKVMTSIVRSRRLKANFKSVGEVPTEFKNSVIRAHNYSTSLAV